MATSSIGALRATSTQRSYLRKDYRSEAEIVAEPGEIDPDEITRRASSFIAWCIIPILKTIERTTTREG